MQVNFQQDMSIYNAILIHKNYWRPIQLLFKLTFGTSLFGIWVAVLSPNLQLIV